MPVYEYLCSNCQAKFEKLRPMTDGHQARCPNCGTESPRVLSMFAAVSRGTEGDSACMGGCGGACDTAGACRCAGMAGG